MKIQITQTIPPLETIKKTNTLDAPLADTQAVEVTIDRGTNIEHRSRNLPQNIFISAIVIDMTSKEQQTLTVVTTPIASSTPIKHSGQPQEIIKKH